MKLAFLVAPLALFIASTLAPAQDHGHETPPAGTAAAHDDHGHDDHAHEVVGPIPTVKQGLATGLTAVVVFLIVAAFLGVVVWPKISGGLDDRANKIRSEIESAELAQQQARAALAQYEKNLAEARAEAQRMLDQAKVQQQALAADLKAKSDIELAAMRDRARRDIEAAKRAALAEIYNEAGNLATSVAGKILRREIGPSDQQRLVQESLHELQGAGRA